MTASARVCADNTKHASRFLRPGELLSIPSKSARDRQVNKESSRLLQTRTDCGSGLMRPRLTVPKCRVPYF
jgi:hypothetical protein